MKIVLVLVSAMTCNLDLLLLGVMILMGCREGIFMT